MVNVFIALENLHVKVNEVPSLVALPILYVLPYRCQYLYSWRDWEVLIDTYVFENIEIQLGAWKWSTLSYMWIVKIVWIYMMIFMD